MRLYESEGKQLLKEDGLRIPQGKVIDSPEQTKPLFPVKNGLMVKPQVLWGKRGKAGAILSCGTEEELTQAIRLTFQRKLFGGAIKKVLIEEKIDRQQESYLSITYQDSRPTIIASYQGGMDIEEIKEKCPQKMSIQSVDIIKGLSDSQAGDILEKAGFAEDVASVKEILLGLYKLFVEKDLLLAEINPLIKATGGYWYACDAKIEVDDEAIYRLEAQNLPKRAGSGRELTPLEIMARKNDLLDTRGAAGRMFYEIEEGNIVILAAGGGTGVEALDDLCFFGGRPAIFTEYSGNPTKEKVKGLTTIALKHHQRMDCIWVIGGRANFTDIYETLVGGIIEGIRQTKGFDKTIPIIVRRAGPRDKEAYEALRKAREQEGYNIFLRGMATSVSESARMVVYQANKHYNHRRKQGP